jgi:hypothetical protein
MNRWSISSIMSFFDYLIRGTEINDSSIRWKRSTASTWLIRNIISLSRLHPSALNIFRASDSVLETNLTGLLNPISFPKKICSPGAFSDLAIVFSEAIIASHHVLSPSNGSLVNFKESSINLAQRIEDVLFIYTLLHLYKWPVVINIMRKNKLIFRLWDTVVHVTMHRAAGPA